MEAETQPEQPAEAVYAPVTEQPKPEVEADEVPEEDVPSDEE